MQMTTENGQGFGNELKDDTKSVANAAVDRLHSEVDSRKSGGVDQINEVSSALKRTAGEMGDRSPEWLKSAIEKGAEQISGFAQSLEQKDSRELLEDVNAFARQSPGTFLAACAAAGFAAARVFKAGAAGTTESPTPTSQDDFSTATFSSSGNSGSAFGETSGLPGAALQGAEI